MEVERMRGASGLEQAKVTAGAKAAGSKGKDGGGDEWSLNNQEKLGKMQINDDKGNPLPILQAQQDRLAERFARSQAAFAAAEGDDAAQQAINDAWLTEKAAIMGQKGQMQTGNMLQTRQNLEDNSQGSRALNAGLWGAAGTAALLGGGALFRNKKMLADGVKKASSLRQALLGGVGGGVAGGTYGWNTGASGVPIAANVDQLSPDAVYVDEANRELLSKQGRGSLRAPLSLLSDEELARYGVR